MTVAESEKLFLDGAFLDPGNARQQALRGTYDPAYLNYTLGKLMILKLREDWMPTRGGRKALEGLPRPVPVLRRAAAADGAQADAGRRRRAGAVDSRPLPRAGEVARSAGEGMHRLKNWHLFAICVLTWGTTWHAILYQLGTMAPEVGVAIRFTLAGAVVLALCIARHERLRFTLSDHALLALQGGFMYGAGVRLRLSRGAARRSRGWSQWDIRRRR